MRIHLKEVIVRHPLIETHSAGVSRRRSLYGSEVPLAEMTGGVSGFLHDVGDANLFRSDGKARSKGSVSVGMTSGYDTAARRRADRGSGVEPIHTKTGCGHLVEYGCVQIRMTVIGRLVPAVVIAHEEDNIRAFGCILLFCVYLARGQGKHCYDTQDIRRQRTYFFHHEYFTQF